jgi:hypothetical protein
MKSHDAEKLDVEVKLKVEHLTLVAWDRSVDTRLNPHESNAASPNQIPCLDWAGSGPRPAARTSRVSRCSFWSFFPEDWKYLIIYNRLITKQALVMAAVSQLQ